MSSSYAAPGPRRDAALRVGGCAVLLGVLLFGAALSA